MGARRRLEKSKKSAADLEAAYNDAAQRCYPGGDPAFLRTQLADAAEQVEEMQRQADAARERLAEVQQELAAARSAAQVPALPADAESAPSTQANE